MFKLHHPRADISIEQETPRVPLDHKYYVIKDGNIIKSFRSLQAAQKYYRKLVEEMNLTPLPKQLIKVSTKQIIAEELALRSNKSLLGIPWGPKGKKSGRFHKVR